MRYNKICVSKAHKYHVEMEDDFMKKIISTDKAPAAIGPYSQAIAVGDFVFTSGVIPIDPATGELVTGGIEVQAEQAIKKSENRSFRMNCGGAYRIRTGDLYNANVARYQLC